MPASSLWTPTMIVGLGMGLLVNAAYLAQPWREPGCSPTLDGHTYNLCPLFHRDPITIRLRSSPDDSVQASEKQSFYQIDLRDYPRTVEDDLDASRAVSWICLHDTDEGEHIEIARGHDFELLRTSKHKERNVVYLDEHGHVNFHLMGGFHQSYQQHARIEFICDPDVDETQLLSSPEFIDTVDHVHTFTWATKYGCSSPSTATHRDETLRTNDLNARDDGRADDDKESDEDKDLLPPSDSSSRRFTAFLFSIAVLLMWAVGYVICYPPTGMVERYITPLYERVTHLPSGMKALRPFRNRRQKHAHHQFRVNEGRLVRWAQEDSRILGEEDLMVNSYDEDDSDWPLDEYIPLKPGMDLAGAKVKNYGSA